MNSVEFAEIRKRLDKTQKEVAALLGISLKAVCSYEQGWRTIPTHVERHLLYLLARKTGCQQDSRNCWDIRNCPEETKEKCPAWEFDSGQFCWFVSGTMCQTGTLKAAGDKMDMCKKCEVMAKLK